VDAYLEAQADDWADVLTRFGEVRAALTDELECCALLQNLLKGTSSEPYFLSIMHHLLLVRR
jgi:hypothetical protein